MKLAIGGKGGVGKSTVAAAICRLLVGQGHRVLAVDADPAANLAVALGIPENLRRTIEPIAARKALIEERTGAKVKQYGQIFKLNPRVDDLAQVCGLTHDGVVLLVLGAIEAGGAGCACPEAVLLRALVADLVLNKTEDLVIDFEAGVEHLGRATARGVDALLVVVEPGQRAVDCGRRVVELAGQIGLKDLRIVANKITSPADLDFIRTAFPSLPLAGAIPDHPDLRRNDRLGRGVLDQLDPSVLQAFQALIHQLTP